MLLLVFGVPRLPAVLRPALPAPLVEARPVPEGGQTVAARGSAPLGRAAQHAARGAAP